MRSVISYLNNQPELSTFADLIKELKLTETFCSLRNFTLFAPSNEAFNKLKCIPERNLLVQIIYNHIIGGIYKTNDLEDGETYFTYDKYFPKPNKLGVSKKCNCVFMISCPSNPRVTSKIINKNNDVKYGIVQVVNKVLLPCKLEPFPGKYCCKNICWKNKWRIPADKGYFFYCKDSPNNSRSIGYNTETGHLLVPSRTYCCKTGAFITILNKCGKVIGRMNTEKMEEKSGDGSIICNHIYAYEGKIYVCNLAYLKDQTFRVWRYENEKDVNPVNIISYKLKENSERLGDVLTVSGMKVFSSGTNNDNIFYWENQNWELEQKIKLPNPGDARFGITSSDIEGNYLFISSAGENVKYIKINGEVLCEFKRGEFFVTNIRYFEYKNRKLLAGIDGFSSGIKMVELRGETLENLCSKYCVYKNESENYADNINLNATGQIINDNCGNLYELITNNGISKYNFFEI